MVNRFLARYLHVADEMNRTVYASEYAFSRIFQHASRVLHVGRCANKSDMVRALHYLGLHQWYLQNLTELHKKKKRKTANVKVGFILNQSNCLRNCMLSFFFVALLFDSISVWFFVFVEHTKIGWCFIMKQKREKSHGFSNNTEKKFNQISCNYVLHHCTES